MLIRQTLQYAPAQIIGPLAQFIGVVIWTHLLGPSEYGFVLLILAIQELGYLVGLFWWSSYTLRYFSGVADRAAFQACENTVMLLAALAQVPVVLAGLAWTGHLSDLPLVASTLLYVVSRSALTHVSERARAAGDIGTYTASQTLGPLLGLPLGLLALRFMPAAVAVTGGFALVQFAILPLLLARLGCFVRPVLRLRPRPPAGGPALWRPAAGGGRLQLVLDERHPVRRRAQRGRRGAGPRVRRLEPRPAPDDPHRHAGDGRRLPAGR